MSLTTKRKEYNSRLNGFDIIDGFEGTVKSICLFRCRDCGGEFERQLSSQLYQNPDCPKCKHREMLENLRESGFGLIEEFSGDVNEKHSMKCLTCGWETNRTIAHQIHRQHGCRKCRSTERERMVEDSLEDLGYRLKEEFKGTQSKQHIIECLDCGASCSRKLRTIIYHGIECQQCAQERRVKRVIGNLEELDMGLVGEYKGVNAIHQIRCKQCGEEFNRLLDNQLSKELACPSCSPTSQRQRELIDFIQDQVLSTTTIQEDVSGVLGGARELDIYLPEHDLAIEYHGLPWHCEKFNHDKYLHHQKWEECQDEGVQLLQFFGDQWRHKTEVCKSIILHALNETPHTIYARKCDLVEMDDGYEKFFDKNHIDGNVFARKAYGLMYNGELVSCMSIKDSPRHSQYTEIMRFCNKTFHHIPGATSKLVSAIDERPLMTYVDLSVGNGAGYEKCGFVEAKKTPLQYWYTDTHDRYSRQKVQATDDQTEREVATEKGLYRIYGTKNKLFTLEN